jgi:hypothetical protein
MARILADVGEPETAKAHYSRALLGSRSPGVDVAALADFAALLESLGDGDVASRHRQLAAAIRIENGWPVPAAAAAESGGASGDRKALREGLRPIWEAWSDAGTPWSVGHVKTILPNGAAGFIVGEDAIDYYFSLRDVEDAAEVAKGTSVEFVPGKRFDKKRGEHRPAATRVRLAGDALSR